VLKKSQPRIPPISPIDKDRLTRIARTHLSVKSVSSVVKIRVIRAQEKRTTDDTDFTDRPAPSDYMTQRIRINFQKQGPLRFIGHRDLARTFERVLRRAGLALSLSGGFHPKPRLSFPLALAVGIAGTEELMEVVVEGHVAEPLGRLTDHCPPGLVINSIEILPEGAPKLQAAFVEYELPIPADRQAAARERIESLWQRAECCVHRPDRHEPIDVREDLDSLTLENGRLRIRQRVSRRARARPREILSLLGMEDLEQEHGLYLTRTAIEWSCSRVSPRLGPRPGPRPGQALQPTHSPVANQTQQQRKAGT
jgi:radical SAM-linked protein